MPNLAWLLARFWGASSREWYDPHRHRDRVPPGDPMTPSSLARARALIFQSVVPNVRRGLSLVGEALRTDEGKDKVRPWYSIFMISLLVLVPLGTYAEYRLSQMRAQAQSWAQGAEAAADDAHAATLTASEAVELWLQPDPYAETERKLGLPAAPETQERTAQRLAHLVQARMVLAQARTREAQTAAQADDAEKYAARLAGWSRVLQAIGF